MEVIAFALVWALGFVVAVSLNNRECVKIKEEESSKE